MPSPILMLHVLSGAVALASGTVAVIVRKGSRWHLQMGIVFAIAMLTLGASGAWLGVTRSQPGNVIGGLMTIYMVATGWIAGRPAMQQSRAAAWSSLAAGIVFAAALFGYGAMVVRGYAVQTAGTPVGMTFFMGGVVVIAACGDLRWVVRGTLPYTARISRHLWRMCFALFIASGSFFMGRARIFPAAIQRSQILLVLTVLPLLLAFWLVRVRVRKKATAFS